LARHSSAIIGHGAGIDDCGQKTMRKVKRIALDAKRSAGRMQFGLLPKGNANSAWVQV